MDAGILIVGTFILLFGFVVLLGAPYLPSRRRQITAALELLNLKPGQTLIDLGSGDGRVLKEAAKRGLKAVGYELNPLLVLIARMSTLKYRNQVKVIWGNYWRAVWPAADGIFVFLRGDMMHKLHNKVMRYPHKPIRVASYAFKIPSKKAQSTKAAIFLYKYN